MSGNCSLGRDIDIHSLFREDREKAEVFSRKLKAAWPGDMEGLMYDEHGRMTDDAVFEYCFGSFTQEGSLERYLAIASVCRENGIRAVYDVGCCIAFQARIFHEYGIGYTGIEISSQVARLLPVMDGVSYINRAYPFPVRVEDVDHSAIVSELCIGYLCNGQEVLDRMSEDFRYYVGLPGSNLGAGFRERFPVVSSRVVEGCPLYFSENARFRGKAVDLAPGVSGGCEVGLPLVCRKKSRLGLGL